MAIFEEGINETPKNTGSVWMRITDPETLVVPLQPFNKVVKYKKHDTWGKKQIHHVCLGTPDCPGCKAGIAAKKKTTLVFMKRDEGVPMIWEMPKTIYNYLIQYWKEAGEDEDKFVGQVFKIVKTGQKLNTRYTVLPTMERIPKDQLPDPESYPDVKKILVTDLDKIIETYYKEKDDEELPF